MPDNIVMHGTTILGFHRKGKTAICGDGQVTLGDSVIKAKAIKIRKIYDGKVIIGFAGATADAFTLFEKFEEKLKTNKGNLRKSAVDLAKEWRQDKYLRRLEAMLIAGDKSGILMISGVGDVMEPDDGLIAVGSGGNYALAAARALALNTSMSEEKIVLEALRIAGEICIYTNDQCVVEVL
jgi:ATP-dependent HslUV protease, peptidase subunit HslV